MKSLELKNIKKSFDDSALITDLNLRLEPGSITSLIGHNGAGKSTTIKMILNLIHPDAGEILVSDSPINKTHFKKIGYLPEVPVLPEHLSATEFLQYICKIFDIPTNKRDDLIHDLLKKVGLLGSEKKRIKHYSKGMRQRLGFAQAILNKPELLILDEPFDGLDPHGSSELRQLISDMKAPDTIILISSHRLAEMKQISDRYILMEQGVIIDDISNFKGDIEALYLEKFSGGYN